MIKKIGIGLGSFLWSALNEVQWLLYSWGVLKAERLAGAGRVISIGNMQVGGAGKTPLAMHLAREALSRGRSVCVLTRGYQSAWEHCGGILVPGLPLPEALECGANLKWKSGKSKSTATSGT